MDFRVVLPAILPLFVAALLAILRPLLPRWAIEGAAILTSIAVTILSAVCTVAASKGLIVYWFGNWFPNGTEVTGIGFAVDPLGAGMATLCGFVMTLALVFGTRYLDDAEHLYFVIMLVFLAGLCGFCLSGDLFNLFVWFELFSVCAFVLTAQKAEEKGPVQGAWNFAITNGAAAYLMLNGIALLYGKTGTFNLALMGERIAQKPPDALVVVAFALICVGFLTKAALVPFHFWLADAHAVAPSPVCALFSGVMVPIGVFGVARVYWTVFAGHGGFAQAHLSPVLLALGSVTAIAGGVLALRQRQIKRLAASTTISHTGLFVIALALFSAQGLSGLAIYVVAHALVKTVFFLAFGVMLNREESLDERVLFGKGRKVPVTGAMVLIAALASADLPILFSALGPEAITRAAREGGHGALVHGVFFVTAILVGAASLRMTLRVFLGIGVRPETKDLEQGSQGEREEADTKKRMRRTPVTMVAPIALCGVLIVALRFVPGVEEGVDRAAHLFADRHAYMTAVLYGPRTPLPDTAKPESEPWEKVPPLASAVLAVAWAAFAVARRKPREAGRLLSLFERLHSGHSGDDAAWLTVGAAILGAAFLMAI